MIFNSSEGITTQGYIDFAHDKVDMSGAFVPIYAVNSLVTGIPVVGVLLGGGSHEGLFAVNFRIAGAGERADPDYQSALRPDAGHFSQDFWRDRRDAAAAVDPPPVDAPPMPVSDSESVKLEERAHCSRGRRLRRRGRRPGSEVSDSASRPFSVQRRAKRENSAKPPGSQESNRGGLLTARRAGWRVDQPARERPRAFDRNGFHAMHTASPETRRDPPPLAPQPPPASAP